MTAVLVVGAIAVVGAVVARVTWRRPADERHSIQSHQHTLDTLRSMADRRPAAEGDRPSAPSSDAGPGAPVRPAKSRPGPAHAGSSPSAPGRRAPVRTGTVRAPAPAPAPSNGHSGGGLVFVDDVAPSSSATNGQGRSSVLTLPGGRLPRAGRHHGRRGFRGTPVVGRLVPVAAAIVVLGIVVGAAVALSPSHRTNTADHRTDRPPKSSAHVTHPRPTVPPPLQVKPTTSTSSTAAYGAPATAFTVGLTATGPCWVEATQASTGHVVWTGTLVTGETHSIPGTGSLFLRLGAANDITVTLNGEPVVLPTGFQSPFDMSFQST